MANFDVTDREQLQAFLETVSEREDGRSQVVAFSARSALRVVPYFTQLDFAETSTHQSGIILPSLRAIAVSWVAGTYPTHDTALSARSAARSAHSARSAARSAHSARSAADSAHSAADSAHSAAYSAYSALSARSAARSAHSAARSAADSAHSALSVLNTDVDNLDTGQILSGQALWSATIPDAMVEDWKALSEKLLDLDAGWEVWTDWYEARVRGGPTHPELSPAANERIEVARVLEIEDDDWNQGAAHVNAKIKAIIERERGRDEHERSHELQEGDIPEPKPSSVSVIWRSGKAYLDTSTLSADVATTLADEEKRALCNEIKELIAAIADDVNYDISPRNYLEKTLRMFPTAAPTSAELLKLARRETTLNEYAASVNAEWPEFHAAHFRSVLGGLSAYLNLFPLRRKRRRIDISGVLEDVTGREARQDIERTSEVLKTETGSLIVDNAVPIAIDNVAQEIPDTEEPLKGAAREAAVDAYEGINNTAIAVAHNAGDTPNAVALLLEIGAESAEEAEAFFEGRRAQRLEAFEKLGRAEGKGEVGYQISSGVAKNRGAIFGWIKARFSNWGK